MFKTFAQCVSLSGGGSGEFKLLTTLKNRYFGENSDLPENKFTGCHVVPENWFCPVGNAQ